MGRRGDGRRGGWNGRTGRWKDGTGGDDGAMRGWQDGRREDRGREDGGQKDRGQKDRRVEGPEDGRTSDRYSPFLKNDTAMDAKLPPFRMGGWDGRTRGWEGGRTGKREGERMGRWEDGGTGAQGDMKTGDGRVGGTENGKVRG